MRKKYTPPQSQTIPLDVSGNMMDVIVISKPGGKGNPGTIRIQKRPDTFSPFEQVIAWDKASPMVVQYQSPKTN